MLRRIMGLDFRGVNPYDKRFGRVWRGSYSSRKGALVGPPQEVSKNRNLLDLNRQLEGA